MEMVGHQNKSKELQKYGWYLLQFKKMLNLHQTATAPHWPDTHYQWKLKSILPQDLACLDTQVSVFETDVSVS